MSPIYSQMAPKNIYTYVSVYIHVCVHMRTCVKRETMRKQMALTIN